MSAETTDLKALLGLVAAGQALSRAQAETAFNIIMSGDATPSQIGAFLMALRVRGETVEEITGAAVTMRAKMLAIEAPEGAIDICGTGGDGTATFNISTASQFVLAACGLPVAKHGNRALSSKCGAADVLAALGVNLDADMGLVKQALTEAGTCFLMAPRHHSAMRHVGPTRVELGTRTIFNLLGPLANPARVKRQLIGVFSAAWVEPLAEVLKGLGHERAWVVHGDGMDEVTTTGVTQVAELKDGILRKFEITPEDAGLDRASIDELRGGGAEENAAALRRLLDGEKGPYRDIVLMGSAAALMMAGKTDALTEGVAMAAGAIDSGGAKDVLAKLVRITTAKVEE
jgi:anthranilate phosphoribosyltransferase